MDFDKRELRVALDRGVPPVAIDIVGGVAARGPFRIANISRSGMFVEGPSEALDIERGSSLHFALRVAGDGASPSDELTGVAKVRWVRESPDGPYQPRGLGLQVIEFHDQAERRFHELLESCLVNLRVTDLMDPAVITCRAETTIREATQLMQARGKGSIIATDEEGAPLGIFTRSDMLRIVHRERFLDERIGQHMTPGPVMIATEQPLDDAFTMLRQGKLNHLPVVEDEIVVGLLSTRDLVRYWAEHTELKIKRLGRSYERAMGVIAHDLRTPLGVVQSANAMLTSGELTPADYVATGLPEMIDQSCVMMLELIDDILDLSRVRAGAVRLRLVSVDVVELLRRAARAFGPSARARRLTLEVKVSAGLPCIKADPLRLEQVVNNLVSNALKFSPEGSVVRLGAEPAHSRIAFWVEDEGPGIPEDEVKGIFREFATASPRPVHGEKSTGLGLAIVKCLVEAHGGTIEVDTKPGAGSRFTVHLPIGELQ